jgi:hypothetical protein
VAVNIKPLVNTAAMIGSTIDAMLRMGFLLVATAKSVRICNITILVEITRAKAGMVVALFATGLAREW